MIHISRFTEPYNTETNVNKNKNVEKISEKPCITYLTVVKDRVMENPVGYLNEKFQPPNRPQYRIVSGPPENPNFSIELSLKGRNFYGEGKSKKEAKKSSAQKAVDELIQSRMEQKVIEFEKGVLFRYFSDPKEFGSRLKKNSDFSFQFKILLQWRKKKNLQ